MCDSPEVDVSIESKDGSSFLFANVRKKRLDTAIERAEQDGTFSLVSSDSAAIVVPWRIVSRVCYVPVDEHTEDEDDWIELWVCRGDERAQG